MKFNTDEEALAWCRFAAAALDGLIVFYGDDPNVDRAGQPDVAQGAAERADDMVEAFRERCTIRRAIVPMILPPLQRGLGLE